MTKKNLVSLSVAFAFLSLSITGLLLYVGKKPHFVETIHVIFGLVFIGFVIFHIINNWSSLVSYSRVAASGKIKKEFVLVFVFFVFFLIGSAFEITPFPQLKEVGEDLFREKRERRPEKISFESVKTNQDDQGSNITLIIQKKNDIEHPSIVIWVEDANHHFVNNLFVPAQIASIKKDTEEEEREVVLNPLTPSTFPHWQEISTSKTPNYKKATPADNFILNTKSLIKDHYSIMIEIINEKTSETYSSELDLSKGNVFAFKSNENLLLDRAILEIR